MWSTFHAGAAALPLSSYMVYQCNRRKVDDGEDGDRYGLKFSGSLHAGGIGPFMDQILFEIKLMGKSHMFIKAKEIVCSLEFLFPQGNISKGLSYLIRSYLNLKHLTL